MSLFKTMLTPFQLATATTKAERNVVALGVLLQNPQIKLHHVPADDHVWVEICQPCIEFFQQLRAAVDILEYEVAFSIGVAIRRPKHVDMALAAAFQDRKSTRLNSSHLGISYAVF